MLKCPVCKSDQFYDDDQGTKSCSLCGTQSQEWFEESCDVFDAGNNNMVSKIGGRVKVRSKKQVR